MPDRRPQLTEAGWDRRFVLSHLRKRTRPRIVLPLIPLIDITFQLLLFFMLTSTFAVPERQLTGFLPSAGGAQNILLPIHVTLDPAGAFNAKVQYRINDEAPTADADKLYASFLARAKSAGSSEVPVIIHAGEDVRWAYVIEVFNAASSAGFTAVTFAPLRPPA